MQGVCNEENIIQEICIIKNVFPSEKTAVQVLHQFYIKSFDVRAICDVNSYL